VQAITCRVFSCSRRGQQDLHARRHATRHICTSHMAMMQQPFSLRTMPCEVNRNPVVRAHLQDAVQVYRRLGKAIAVLGSGWIPFCHLQVVSYACGINAPLDELRRGLVVLGATRIVRRIERVRTVRYSSKVFGRRQSIKTRTSSSVPRRATLLVTFALSNEHDGDQHGHGKFRDM
jgi:hypothetical protein